MQKSQKKQLFAKMKKPHKNVFDFIAACKKNMGEKIGNRETKSITMDQRYYSNNKIRGFPHQNDVTKIKEKLNSRQQKQRRSKIKSSLFTPKQSEKNYRPKTPCNQNSNMDFKPIFNIAQLKNVNVNLRQAKKLKILQFLKNIEGINNLKIKQEQQRSDRKNINGLLINANNLTVQKFPMEINSTKQSIKTNNVSKNPNLNKRNDVKMNDKANQDKLRSNLIFQNFDMEIYNKSNVHARRVKPFSAQSSSSSNRRSFVGTRDCSKTSILKESQQKNIMNQCINIKIGKNNTHKNKANIKKCKQNQTQHFFTQNKCGQKKLKSNIQNKIAKQNIFVVDQNVKPWDFQASMDNPFSSMI